MRFVAHGPSIPDELLEQRDRGNVVFFCGAGVSMPAGLPNFPKLTERVMQALGTPPDAPSRRLFEQSGEVNLDQVFNRLNEEYPRDEVERTVSRILATPRKTKSDAHSIILRLSRNALRRPRLVTTNFDLLFERVRKVPIHVAPALPDIAASGGFEGIVYLHGRRASGRNTIGNRFVLASSDFGRAYLADGWATRFVRDLLQKHLIVLVGYSASDPPVRYLLEGLNSRRNETAATIYAFDHGPFDEVVGRWRSRGVTAMPYSMLSGREHADLWDTLRAWADRADDPDAWRNSIVGMARQGPVPLAPFHRGQVASLVRNPEGAIAFSTAPPPAAEWLCVFDRHVRYGAARARAGDDEADPLEVYGLDDDPPRAAKETDAGAQVPDAALGDDLIAISAGDERSDRHKRLAGVSVRHGDLLPARLSNLAGWFGNVADQPTAIWWAGGYPTLHPQLLRIVEWHFDRNDFSEFGMRAWRVLLERFRYSPERSHDDGWYTFLLRLKREGWTRQVIRDFERAAQPYLSTRRPSGHSLFPPTTDVAPERLDAVVDFDVEYPGYDREQVEVSSAILPTVFEIARRALERAADLLGATEVRYWRTASFLPDEEPGTRYLNDASKYFHWVRDLFDRLTRESSSIARNEMRRWRHHEKYFFDKFRIYAWMKAELIPSREVAEDLLSLSDEAFWESSHRRELLHTLRSRWSEFGNALARKIESRIITGQKPWPDEKKKDHRTRVRTTAATMLGWLDRRGCHLSPQALKRLKRLQAQIADWRDSWSDSADHSLDGRAGSVATDTDPTVLLNAPLSQIAALTEQYSKEDVLAFLQHDPFQGLVEKRPRRALAALAFEARRGKVQTRLWGSLLGHWPRATSERLLALCAGRVARLPNDALVGLRYDVGRWFREHSPRFALNYPSLAYQLFDRAVDSLFAAGEGAATSAIGDVSVGGRTPARSRRTHMHAINSSIGNLSEGLLRILIASKPKAGSGIPFGIRDRLERVLGSPGEGSAHAVTELALELKWLYYVDPAWATKRLLPLFDLERDSAEPAWNGLLSAGGGMPVPRLFSLLKPHLMRAFDVASDWVWDHDTAFNKLVEFLVLACFLKRRRASYVSYQEARTILRKVDDAARAHTVWFLATIVAREQAWDSFGRHFIEKAWPRESRFQTPALSKQFAFLAEQSGEQFPRVVEAVGPLLIRADGLDLMVHRTTMGNGEATLATRFPVATLDLLDRLIPEEPKPVPYELGVVITSIAEAAPDLRRDQRWRRLRRIADGA